MRTQKPQHLWSFPFQRAGMKTLIPILLVFFIGCSNENGIDEIGSVPTDGNPKSVAADGSNRTSQNGSANSGANSKIRIDKNGQKWWNKHPYDIWFDDPLKIAANKTPVENRSSNPSTDPDNDSPPEKKKTVSELKKKIASTGTDWKTILPIETISSEVKNIRNTLSRTMQTVGKYNTNFEEIPAHAATLSVLAMILEKHPESLTWKEDTLYVRDLGLSIEEAAEGRGRKNYDATLKPFEQFISILDRNKPPDLAEPEKEIEFADRANMNSVMKRMKKAYQFLKSDTNNEDVFKEKSNQVVHEARILAALTKFITDKSYVISEEKEFLEHAKGITDDSLQIVEAGNNSNFKLFRAAIERITNRCAQCHTAYR